MPPKAASAAPPFEKDKKVLCFHLDMLYEAKVLDYRPTEDGQSWMYRIHYKGWKNTWDDWVPQDRVREFNEENRELAAQLHEQMRQLQQRAPRTGARRGGRANGSEADSARDSEETHPAAQGGRGPRRNRDYDVETEADHHARPKVKIPMPDHIKALLVDDWENVTKNLQLVPLPHPYSVNRIIEEYVAHEAPKREAGSASADLLEEAMTGIKTYFELALGRSLLYRFERLQLREVHDNWASNKPEWEGKKTACDTYGAEHFCRLMSALPELVAQTNIDRQSAGHLREEMTKLMNWIARHATTYFVSEYESPGAAYIEKARRT